MALSPSEKVVLISGATSGIGRATALELARRGYRVFAGYRQEARGTGLLIEAGKEKLPLSILPLDINRADQIENAVKQVLSRTGRIDVLINNAGYGLAGPVEELDMTAIRAQFETNVFGHIRLTQAVIPSMRTAGSGTLLFMSSVSGRLALPFFSAYCGSKHAIECFAEALRYEMSPFGVRVILIEPGMIRTDFVRQNLILTRRSLEETSPYAKPARSVKERYWKKDASSPPPELVARRIARVLELRRPPLRVPIGRESSWLILLKKFIPARGFELLMIKFYELDRLK